MTISEFFNQLKFRLWSQRSILLLVRPAGKPLDESRKSSFPGEFRPVTASNIEDCAAFENYEHYVPLYRKMLERGDYGQYGYLNGACVYREWLQKSGPVTFDGCTVFQLREHECCSEYVFCSPSARGKGFQAASEAHLISLFPQLTFYTMVLPEKPFSLKNYLRNGYEIRSLLTVKNRFLRRTLEERPLSPEEAQAYLPKSF